MKGTINVSSMSNAELIQWSKNLKNSNSAQNAELKAAVEKELKLRKLDTDTVSFTSSTSTIGTNFDAEAVNATMESLAADAAELQVYDDKYNSLVETQSSIESECMSFVYPKPESIKTSSQAERILKDVKAQIARIEELIRLAEESIKVLEEEKEVAQAQIKKREEEKAQLEQEMENIKKQIENNEAQAQLEVQNFEKYTASMIDKYTKEYQSRNLETQGIKLEEFLTQKMAAHQLPSSVAAFYNQNDNLVRELNTKGEQVKLIAGAIDSLNNKIANIDQQLEIQNGKLEDYNTNLSNAKEYHSKISELKSALQRKEGAQRKKEKWYRKLASGLASMCKNLVNTITKALGKIFKGMGNIFKFTGKMLGDVSKSIGLGDKWVEGAFNTAAGSLDFVSAVCTWDEDDMKTALKDIEDGVKNTIENNVLKKVAEHTADALDYAGEKVGDVVETVSFGAINDNAFEKSFNSIGNTVRGVGAATTLDINETSEHFENAAKDAVNSVFSLGTSLLGVVGITDGITNSFKKGAWQTTQNIGNAEINSILNSAFATYPLNQLPMNIKEQIKQKLLSQLKVEFEKEYSKFANQIEDGEMNATDLFNGKSINHSNIVKEMTNNIIASMKDFAVDLLLSNDISSQLSFGVTNVYMDQANNMISNLLNTNNNIPLEDNQIIMLKNEILMTIYPIINENIQNILTKNNITNLVNCQNIDFEEIENTTLSQVTEKLKNTLPSILNDGGYINSISENLSTSIMSSSNINSILSSLTKNPKNPDGLDSNLINNVKETIKESIKTKIEEKINEIMTSQQFQNLSYEQIQNSNNLMETLGIDLNQIQTELTTEVQRNLPVALMQNGQAGQLAGSLVGKTLDMTNNIFESVSNMAQQLGINPQTLNEIKGEINSIIAQKTTTKAMNTLTSGNLQNLDLNKIQQEIEQEILAEISTLVVEKGYGEKISQEFTQTLTQKAQSFINNIIKTSKNQFDTDISMIVNELQIVLTSIVQEKISAKINELFTNPINHQNLNINTLLNELSTEIYSEIEQCIFYCGQTPTSNEKITTSHLNTTATSPVTSFDGIQNGICKVECNTTPQIERIQNGTHLFKLTNDITYTITHVDTQGKEQTYEIPIKAGYTWDGASIPDWLTTEKRESIGLKEDDAPEYAIASMIHDITCENQSLVGGNRALSSSVFQSLLIENGVDENKAKMMTYFVDAHQSTQGW